MDAFEDAYRIDKGSTVRVAFETLPRLPIGAIDAADYSLCIDRLSQGRLRTIRGPVRVGIARDVIGQKFLCFEDKS